MMLRQVHNNLEKITVTLNMNDGDCTSLEKDNFGRFLLRVTVAWRHVPPSVLRHSDDIDKSWNGSNVLSVSLL